MQWLVGRSHEPLDRARVAAVEERERVGTQRGAPADDGDGDLLDCDVGRGVRRITEEQDVVCFLAPGAARHHSRIGSAGKELRVDGSAVRRRVGGGDLLLADEEVHAGDPHVRRA